MTLPINSYFGAFRACACFASFIMGIPCLAGGSLTGSIAPYESFPDAVNDRTFGATRLELFPQYIGLYLQDN